MLVENIFSTELREYRNYWTIEKNREKKKERKREREREKRKSL